MLAIHNIKYLCLFSHSSRILRPLNEFFFSVVKITFSSKTKRIDAIANKFLLEKFYNTLLTVAKETKIIISFSHGGIIPVTKEGEAASIKISLDKVTTSQCRLIHESCDDHEAEQEEKL